jgi:NAD(P)-dependent dehydrogenase (short-subunit alcohol dehydrogenase family)
MAKLKGKNVLITGGTTGIGFAAAQLMIQEGARVAITGQDTQRVIEAGKALGSQAIAIKANVASASDMELVATRLKKEFGTLNVIFANAGIAQPKSIADIDEQHLNDQIDVNFKGVIFTIQKMLPLLENPASIVLTSTTMIEQGLAGLSVYTATKAAVRSLARTLSAELIGQGIRVNSISPGLIETPIYGKLGMPAEAVNQWATELMKKVPAARFGRADEVAKVALFLASDDSSYMIGENILLDGGMGTI